MHPQHTYTYPSCILMRRSAHVWPGNRSFGPGQARRRRHPTAFSSAPLGSSMSRSLHPSIPPSMHSSFMLTHLAAHPSSSKPRTRHRGCYNVHSHVHMYLRSAVPMYSVCTYLLHMYLCNTYSVSTTEYLGMYIHMSVARPLCRSPGSGFGNGWCVPLSAQRS